MGRMQAMELAGSEMSLKQQIAIHFSGNCYPPIPKMMIPVAVEAINAYRDGEFARVIQLPDGALFKNGENWVFASQAVESLRLDAWLPEIFWTEEDEDDE